MKIIIGKVGSGKTYNILHDCNDKKGILVIPFYKYIANSYKKDIKEWGFTDIKKVITFKEYLDLPSREKEKNHFCFDNIDLLFKDSDSISLTITEPITLVERIVENNDSCFTKSEIC